MINALEYITQRGGQTFALRADKAVHERNAWHLKSIDGNGMPPASARGSSFYGIAGKSYSGLAVDSREIGAELYADGYSAASCQQLLNDVSRVVSTDSEALGVLRLTNAAGEAYRIAAKATDFSVSEIKRRAALCSVVFDCPYAYFESDVLNVLPLFAVEGGKEYHTETGGLERPYTFGNITAGAADQRVTVFNSGDVAAPCTFRLFGAGLSRVEIYNETTGATIVVSGMSVGGIEICTDPNNLYARFADGADASRYVSLFSDLSAFVLASGANSIRVRMTASSVTVAGTCIEWRGRFTTCL